jgi:hypothetical protein
MVMSDDLSLVNTLSYLPFKKSTKLFTNLNFSPIITKLEAHAKINEAFSYAQEKHALESKLMGFFICTKKLQAHSKISIRQFSCAHEQTGSTQKKSTRLSSCIHKKSQTFRGYANKLEAQK